MEFEWVEDSMEEKKLALDNLIVQQENNLVKQIVDKFQAIYKKGAVYSKNTMNGIKIKYRKSPWSLDRRVLAEINSNTRKESGHPLISSPDKVYCYAQNEEEFLTFKQILSDYHEKIGFHPYVNVKIINYKNMKVFFLNNKTPPKKVNPIPS